MANILAVGIATIDNIYLVERFPLEDSKIRSLNQFKNRGGNATNTLVVLSQLGHQCTWAGMNSADESGKMIEQDLAQYAVNCHCDYSEHASAPHSIILVSQRSGSRTIIHHRELPEYAAKHFRQLNIKEFDWLHFEGRNCIETLEMLKYAKHQAPNIPRSLEIEKIRPNIENLFAYATHLIFSKNYAEEKNLSAQDLLNHWKNALPNIKILCTWGAGGAYATDADGKITHYPAHTLAKPVDTTAAGDTFNAGAIHGWIQGKNSAQALRMGQTLAAKKCQQFGFEALNF